MGCGAAIASEHYLYITPTGQMKGTTDAGQVLVLAMPREELRRMRLGDTFTLVVLQHARVAGSR